MGHKEFFAALRERTDRVVLARVPTVPFKLGSWQRKADPLNTNYPHTERLTDGTYAKAKSMDLLSLISEGPGRFCVNDFPKRYARVINNADMLAQEPKPQTLDLAALDRRPDEDDFAWYAFRVWLEIGSETNGGAAYRTFSRLKLSGYQLEETQLRELAKRFEWDRRTAIFDSLHQRRAIELTAEALTAMKERQITLAVDLQKAASKELAKLIKKIEHSGDLCSLKPRDLVSLLQEGVKLERLTRGEVTDRTSTEGEYDLSKLTLEELQMMKQLQDKAKKSA